MHAWSCTITGNSWLLAMTTVEERIKRWYEDETGANLSEEDVSQIRQNLASLGGFMLRWYTARETTENAQEGPFLDIEGTVE